jgi:hypothetical protein
MKDVGDLLREADPVAREGRLPPDDINRMRRAVVAAVDRESPTAVWWPTPIIVAATVAVTLVSGVLVGRWLPSQDGAIARDSGDASSAAPASPARRQLQFASPGGTRIIWVFDPDFNP